MSETISLELLVKLVRDVQAEQRTLRMENRLIREELGELKGSMLTREMAERMLRAATERISSFEARIETRIDEQNTTIKARFDALEALIRNSRP